MFFLLSWVVGFTHLIECAEFAESDGFRVASIYRNAKHEVSGKVDISCPAAAGATKVLVQLHMEELGFQYDEGVEFVHPSCGGDSRLRSALKERSRAQSPVDDFLGHFVSWKSRASFFFFVLFPFQGFDLVRFEGFSGVKRFAIYVLYTFGLGP